MLWSSGTHGSAPGYSCLDNDPAGIRPPRCDDPTRRIPRWPDPRHLQVGPPLASGPAAGSARRPTARRRTPAATTPATTAAVVPATNPKTSTTTATMVSARVVEAGLGETGGPPRRARASRCGGTGSGATRPGATTITVETTARRERDEEHDPQRGLEVAEALLERHREEEAGEDLQAGLGDAQLLQELVPVPVGALGPRSRPVPARRGRAGRRGPCAGRSSSATSAAPLVGGRAACHGPGSRRHTVRR